MTKEYRLKTEGLQFKADFNWNFDLIRHLLDIRTKSKYYKIDLIMHKESKEVYLSLRVADFSEDSAYFELKPVNLSSKGGIDDKNHDYS